MAEDQEKRITPIKAIRLHCLDCSNGSAYEVAHCPCTDCNLYQFRDGHIPWKKGMGPKNPAFNRKKAEADGGLDENAEEVVCEECAIEIDGELPY